MRSVGRRSKRNEEVEKRGRKNIKKLGGNIKLCVKERRRRRRKDEKRR